MTVKIKLSCVLAVMVLAGCAQRPMPSETKVDVNKLLSNGSLLSARSDDTKGSTNYDAIIRSAASTYGVEERLIKAIIQVESGGKPHVVSPSNAVGLMQLKATTAGRDAYRYKGRYGIPTLSELKDPSINIDLGTLYLSLLQNQQLEGISNPETMRYAVIVAYVNGAKALLNTFSSNRRIAIERINRLTPAQFYQHVQKKHPASQATRYLWKVNTAYLAMR